MYTHARPASPPVLSLIILSLLFVALVAGTVFLALRGSEFAPLSPRSAPAPEQERHLALAEKPSKGAFDPAEIPAWLFVHVGAIASLQALALVAAAGKARRRPFTRQDGRVVQFLVEIPMYLGLFGTLMGVCLTQFIAGSLVAPLAYITTMSGIVLHIVGKLTILLNLPHVVEGE